MVQMGALGMGKRQGVLERHDNMVSLSAAPGHVLLSKLSGTRSPCFLSAQGTGTELSVPPHF